MTASSGPTRTVPAPLQPRFHEDGGRLVISYAGAVAGLWCALALAGIGYGIASLASDGPIEGRYIAFGLGAICTFVAWFAVRPVIVADRTGLSVLPVFGTRVSYRWDEVRAVGVRTTRRSRGRGPSLEIQASDDREAKVDGLAMGITSGALAAMDQRLRSFAGTLALTAPIAVLVDEYADHDTL